MPEDLDACLCFFFSTDNDNFSQIILRRLLDSSLSSSQKGFHIRTSLQKVLFLFSHTGMEWMEESYFCSGHCHTYWEVKQTLEMLLVMRGKQSEIVCQIVQTSLKSDIWKFVGMVILVFAIKK